MVVVDDGSSDGTFESLCRAYGKSKKSADAVTLAPNLSAIRQKNGERGTARNNGVRWAIDRLNPDWFLFVDSDDVLATNAFVHLTERLHSDPSDDVVAVHGVINVLDGESVVDAFPRSPRSVEGHVSQAIIKRPIMSLGASLIRAKTIIDLGGFSERREISGSEDWVLLMRVALRGRVLFVPHVVTLYRQHPRRRKSLPSLSSKDLAVKAMIPDIIAHFGGDSSNAIRLLYRQAEFKKVGALNSHGFWREASQVLFQAIRHDRLTWTDYRMYRLTLSIAKTAFAKFVKEPQPSFPA